MRPRNKGSASQPRRLTNEAAQPSLPSTMSSNPATSSGSTGYSQVSRTPPPIVQVDPEAISLASLTLNTPLIPFNRKKLSKPKPFLFLTLPSEIRIRIYQYYFADTEKVLDLGPDNYKRYHKRLGIVRVCHQVHDEVTHYFYSTYPVRIFPTYPGRYFKTKKPMLARLKPNQRGCLHTLELRVGPGWSAPPKGWTVNDALGLKDCTNVDRLRVFVECDPSDSIFKGFRRSDGFYEGFCKELMAAVLTDLPAVRVIEFDAWNSVKKSGLMMRGLYDVAAKSGHKIEWGPERYWTDNMQEDDSPPGAVKTLTYLWGYDTRNLVAFG